MQVSTHKGRVRMWDTCKLVALGEWGADLKEDTTPPSTAPGTYADVCRRMLTYADVC